MIVKHIKDRQSFAGLFLFASQRKIFKDDFHKSSPAFCRFP